MANKVGIVMALDGEKEFKAGLQAATESVRLAKSELKGLDEQYKGNADSIDALTDRQKALVKVGEALKKKEEEIRKAQKHSNDLYQDIARNSQKLAKEKEDLAKKQEELAKAGKQETDAYKDVAKRLAEVTEAEARENVQKLKQEASYTRWTRLLNESQREIKKNEQELKSVEQAMSEMGNATDGAGNKVDDLENELNSLGNTADKSSSDIEELGNVFENKLMKQFAKEQLFKLAVNGLKKLGEAAVEAAKQVVKIGMDFEQQMSKVAAISGASEQEMEKMSAKAQALGRTTVYTASEAGSAMEQMSLAGFKTEQILSGIDGILSLSSAAGMDLATTAEYITDNINAFGESADYAGQLADIMATAMANSSMTAEDLGEAYSKVASTAHAFGYTEEEVTAVLMNMANSGKKGSEAGTALNTIMIRLATNTSKCSEELKKYTDGQDIIYDQNGHMRELSDILEDLGNIWWELGDEEQAAVSKMIAGTRQTTALNTIMAGLKETTNETNKSFKEYKAMLEDCSGAAKEMADKALDNLAGDITIMNSALSGLAIAAYQYVDGPLRVVVQGVTGIINGITDAITPQKSELELFIADIKESREEVEGMLNRSDETMKTADIDISNLEAYRKILKDLSEQEELDAYQKYQLQNAVNALADTVPGLSEAFDMETGKLKIQNEEFEKMFDNAERVIKQNALIKAQAESYEAAAQAEINKALADAALKEAQEELTHAIEENEKSLDWQKGGYGDNYSEVLRLTEAVEAATTEQTKASKEMDKANDQMMEQEKVYKRLNREWGLQAQTVDELAKSQEDLQDEYKKSGQVVEEVEDVFNEFGEKVTGLEPEDVKSITEETQKIKDAYISMRDSVENSMKSMISFTKEWSQSDPMDSSTILKNLDSQIEGLTNWKKNMETLAEQAGKGMSQEMYDKLVEMGPESAGLVQDLVNSMSETMEDGTSKFEEIAKKWQEAMTLSEDVDGITAYTEQGQRAAEEYSRGLDLGLEGLEQEISGKVIAAVTGANDAGIEEAGSSDKVGNEMTESAGQGVESGSGQIQQALQSAVDTAISGVNTSGGYDIGYQIASGVANGLWAGMPAIESAGNAIIAKLDEIMRKKAEIRSPSRLFKEKVGKQIAAGVAFGISDNASMAGKAAAKLSDTVYKSATSWLKKYKKSNTVSIADEKWYWEQVMKHVKKGSTAYKNAVANLKRVRKEAAQVGTALSDMEYDRARAVKKKIDHAFNVSWHDGKKKKKTAEKYYSDVLSEAEKYLKKQKNVNDWSLKEEEAYWTAVSKKLKKGTSAWAEAKKKVADLKNEIVENRASNQDTILDYYKVYNDVSLKAEMQYWEKARGFFKEGTEQRIEADRKYLDAKEKYYDELKKIDEDYQKNYQDIQDKLEQSISELQENYRQAVKDTSDEILSQMDLFEEFTAEGFDQEKLLKNVQSQIDALALWEATLQDLKDRNVSDELYSYIFGQGVDGVVNAYSIANMTDEQLKQYEELFQKRSELAKNQAVKENKELLATTNSEITEAKNNAAKELEELNEEYKKAVKEINTGISSKLSDLIYSADLTGQNAIAALFKGMEANTEASYTKSGVKKTIADSLGTITEETKEIGKQAIIGMIDGMQDAALIKDGAEKTVSQIIEALKEAADIHSPSRRAKREIGLMLGLGVADGLKEAVVQSEESSREMIRKTMEAANDEYARQEIAFREKTGRLYDGRIARMNDTLKQTYTQNTIVNVDNSAVAGLIGEMAMQMQTMVQTIGNLGIYLDGDVLVGQTIDRTDKQLGMKKRSTRR